MSPAAAVGSAQGGATASPTGTPAPAATASAATVGPLLARIEYSGGAVTEGFALTRLPSLSLYADGTVITQGTAWLSSDPRPLVAPESVQRLTPAGLARVRARIAAARLSSAAYPAAAPGDAPDTVLRLDGGRVVVRLGSANPGASFPPAEAAARRPADDLVAALADIPALAGPGGVSAPEPYVPSALLLYLVMPGAVGWSQSAVGTGSALAWTLPVSPSAFGRPISPGWRCGAVAGAGVPALWQAVSGATELDYVADGQTEWTPFVRPLLPDEAAVCGS